MKEKILITTGGSGGHVLPALNFYEHLKENYRNYSFEDYLQAKEHTRKFSWQDSKQEFIEFLSSNLGN